MEEDERPPEQAGEDFADSPPRSSTFAGFVAFALAAAVLAVAVYTGIAQTATALLVFPGIPLVLLWFVWRVFLRRLWRIRRIRNAQQKRELLEAVLRKRQGNNPR